ncbi:MAG: hypothetical protein JSV82_06970 [Planctomycetota bacterium]|nr:MAG: hypothetical protein JSV82_06970 [Planctomycetota bacterium]
MKSYRKSRVIKSLAILVFVIAVCAITAAENDDEPLDKKEVLTTLEQRMLKRISIDFRNTPIDDVIRIMAEQADVDIVKSPKVIGNVTATLTDVPLEEALNNILTSHGYGYVVDENMIRIAPIEEIAQKAEMLISRIYRITYADVIEIESALKKFISARGSLSSNPGTSNIIVTDAESKIKAIDTFIEEIDRITPQILVEARIYDITSKDKLDLGVVWEAGQRTGYGDSGTTDVGTNPTDEISPFITGVFSGATAKTSGTTGILRFGWLNPNLDIDVLLKAQQNKIDAKLLANPRVLVLDNEKAQIKIISEIPYQELTESSQGGTIGTTSFKEVGVELEVTPHLTRDEMIRLDLKPVFSVKVDDVTFTSAGLTYPQPVVDKRTADTILLVKNGQTVVLGGLRKKEVGQQTNKVPLLGDLPLVGILFRFEGEDTVNSELVVFITPWIIEQPVMSEIEQQQFEVTEFRGPRVTHTRADKFNE